jgi:hypothetical protein
MEIKKSTHMENNRFDGTADNLNRMKVAIPALEERLDGVEDELRGAASALQTTNDTLENILKGDANQ